MELARQREWTVVKKLVSGERRRDAKRSERRERLEAVRRVKEEAEIVGAQILMEGIKVNKPVKMEAAAVKEVVKEAV